jgi:hypothetical protein
MRTTYEKVTQEAIDSFDINDKIWLKDVKNKYIGNLVAFDTKAEFQKYIDHSIDPDTFDINNYKNKKCFIIPGSSRTHARLKDIMKDLDIKIVKDYDDADFLISNNSINTNISKNNVFFDLYSQYMSVGKYNGKYVLESDYMYTGELSNIQRKNQKICKYMISGLYFNLRQTGKEFVPLYHFLKISQDVVLDEDMVEYLTGMIRSTNEEDVSIVKKILPKIDISKNQEVLFKFFDEVLFDFKYSYQRDKDVKNWIEESGVMQWHRDPSDIIRDYHNKGVLSNGGFKYLEAKNRKAIYIAGGSLYNFKVSLKDEYKKYLK